MTNHRILILTNRVPYPLHDGGALAMYSMLEGYHEAGWEVFLFSMNTSRHYVSREELPTLFGKIISETFDINTDVKLLPTLKNFFFSKKPNHASRFYDKAFAGRLQRIIDSFEPEIIQLESIYLATYIPAIKEITKAPVAIRLHNIEYQVWERLSQEAGTSFKRFYLKDLAVRIKRFELTAWHLGDILLPITGTDAETVRTVVKNKEVVITPFGVEVSKSVNEAIPGEWIGYHLGAMDWMPNAEAIIWFLEEVWPGLHKELPRFEFHFAGRNMPGSFEKYEAEGIVCHGEVSDANEFIKDKKILIIPLRSGGGIRVKVLEAFAAGKLIISTSVGMQGIHAAEGTHYLLAETAEDFKKQIKWTLENKAQAAEIANAGTELVHSEYDQEKIMSNLIGRLESIINKTS